MVAMEKLPRRPPNKLKTRDFGEEPSTPLGSLEIRLRWYRFGSAVQHTRRTAVARDTYEGGARGGWCPRDAIGTRFLEVHRWYFRGARLKELGEIYALLVEIYASLPPEGGKTNSGCHGHL